MQFRLTSWRVKGIAAAGAAASTFGLGALVNAGFAPLAVANVPPARAERTEVAIDPARIELVGVRHSDVAVLHRRGAAG